MKWKMIGLSLDFSVIVMVQIYVSIVLHISNGNSLSIPLRRRSTKSTEFDRIDECQINAQCRNHVKFFLFSGMYHKSGNYSSYDRSCQRSYRCHHLYYEHILISESCKLKKLKISQPKVENSNHLTMRIMIRSTVIVWIRFDTRELCRQITDVRCRKNP